MEQNQDKKQKLTAANSVLKLAADLLKVCFTATQTKKC